MHLALVLGSRKILAIFQSTGKTLKREVHIINVQTRVIFNNLLFHEHTFDMR